MLPFVLIVLFTLFSGMGDAYGFTHASKMWENGRVVWAEFGKSLLGFEAGFIGYWLAVRYLKQVGVINTEIQAVLWFGVTIIGVAFLNGNFFHWPRLEQLVALVVLVGMGWLLFRVGG